MEQDKTHTSSDSKKSTPTSPRQPVWPPILILAGFGVLFFLLILSLDNAVNTLVGLRQRNREISSTPQAPVISQEAATEFVAKKEIDVNLPSMTLSGSYTGSLVDGLPDGTGYFAFEIEVDAYYDGEWKNGLFDGYGKLHSGDGLVYEGEYAKGMRNGIVKLFDLHGNFLSVSEYKDDKPVYTDTAYCKTLLDAFKNSCRWTYAPDYYGDAMGHVGTKVIVSGYVGKVVEDGSICYLELYPSQMYNTIFVVRVLDLEYQAAKLSEGDFAMLYAVIDGIAPYKNKNGRDAMGTALSAYSYVPYRPNTEEAQAFALDAEYLDGVWSPNPNAVAYSGGYMNSPVRSL